MLSGVTAVSPSGSDALGATKFPFTALLDSGTTYTFLPDDLAAEIYKETGAVYDKKADSATCPCALTDSPGYLSFEFGGAGGAVVNVSISDLVYPNEDDDGNKYCVFGIAPSSSIG